MNQLIKSNYLIVYIYIYIYKDIININQVFYFILLSIDIYYKYRVCLISLNSLENIPKRFCVASPGSLLPLASQ